MYDSDYETEVVEIRHWAEITTNLAISKAKDDHLTLLRNVAISSHISPSCYRHIWCKATFFTLYAGSSCLTLRCNTKGWLDSN